MEKILIKWKKALIYIINVCILCYVYIYNFPVENNVVLGSPVAQ